MHNYMQVTLCQVLILTLTCESGLIHLCLQRFARLEQRGVALMYRKVLDVEINVSLL